MFNVFNKFFKKMNLSKMTMPKMTMPNMKHHYWLLTLVIILLLAIALGSFFKNLIEGFDNSKTPIYLPKKIGFIKFEPAVSADTYKYTISDLEIRDVNDKLITLQSTGNQKQPKEKKDDKKPLENTGEIFTQGGFYTAIMQPTFVKSISFKALKAGDGTALTDDKGIKFTLYSITADTNPLPFVMDYNSKPYTAVWSTDDVNYTPQPNVDKITAAPNTYTFVQMEGEDKATEATEAKA